MESESEISESESEISVSESEITESESEISVTKGSIRRRNIIALNSKINESRSKEKYCDVTIKIEEKSFKCHRLILGSASEYFDAMFQRNFRDSKSEVIELKELKAATFEEVIEFIYTGDVLVTQSNVLNLIRASEFYSLPNLKTLCCQFVEKEIELGEIIVDALDIFAFIYRADHEDVDECVASLSAYIREYLHYFSNTPSFLNIQFDELKAILKHSAPSKNENEVVHAIIQWVDQSNPSKDVKDEILNILLENINYENVSPEYVKFIVKQCVRERIVSKEGKNGESNEKDSKNDNVLPAEPSPDAGLCRMCVTDSQSLYVYIKMPENVTNVFTLQKYVYGFTWVFLSKANDNSDGMRIVSLDDHLYCLNYFEPHESSTSVQTFSVSSSVSLFDKSYLKAPPLVVNQFDMCGMNNHLYMYNKDIFASVIRSSEDSEFNDEAISRGVYAYNCEIDKWMSLPPPLQKLGNACMTCNRDTSLLYLIGGSNPAQQRLHGYVQTYDPRCATWMSIARTQDFYENGACCFSDRLKAMYVCGGLECPEEPETLCKGEEEWLRLRGVMNSVENCHRLISHGADVWAFGKNVSKSSVEVFHNDGLGWSWSKIVSLSVAVRKRISAQELSSASNVLDCVTFKPFGL